MGRDTKYRSEYCDGIIDFMTDGKHVVEYAAHLRVSRDSLYQWAKDHPEFQEALDVATTMCEAWYLAQARLGMTGHYEGWNAATFIFKMKNCFGWRDKQKDEESKDNYIINFGYSPEKK